jgi:hypothetical protein
MSHATVVVALPSALHESSVREALEAALNPYSMHMNYSSGEWDWWVIGGRWGGVWVLRDGSESALPTDDFSFGRRERADQPDRTDCARLKEIRPESIVAPYSYLDLHGRWWSEWVWDNETNTDIGPSEEEFGKQFFEWVQKLPPDTWLVNVDYHS